jgi:predicted nucleic acid-binding protein
MNGVLVDTSVWIDYFNGKHNSRESALLQKMIVDDYRIYLCPVIYQEIMQGINDDAVFEDVKSIMNNYSMMDLDIMHVTNTAIDLYRSLRKNGVTIRKSNDCLIAAYSLISNIPLFHKDRDFQQIGLHSNLKLFVDL